MLVVSNSSPLIFLSKINRLDLLKTLFRQIIVPKAVYDEVVGMGKALRYPDAIVVEKAVRDGWLIIGPGQGILQILKNFGELHAGEQEAITLAFNKKAYLLLLDDAPARKIAQILKIKARGTIYVLALAYEKGFLDLKNLKENFEQLLNSGFRISPELYARIIRELENKSHMH